MGKVIAALLLIALAGCDHWPEEHAAQCAGWLARSRTASDSLHVEMTCESIAAAHRAEEAGNAAVATSIIMSK